MSQLSWWNPPFRICEELQFLGRRIGLAAYVDSSVPRCPAKHGACTLALVKDGNRGGKFDEIRERAMEVLMENHGKT